MKTYDGKAVSYTADGLEKRGCDASDDGKAFRRVVDCVQESANISCLNVDVNEVDLPSEKSTTTSISVVVSTASSEKSSHSDICLGVFVES